MKGRKLGLRCSRRPIENFKMAERLVNDEKYKNRFSNIAKIKKKNVFFVNDEKYKSVVNR